jgi:plastocyanin
MFAKFTSLALALAVTLIVASAASAGSPPRNASLLIRHQVQGCHTWSANHDAFKASQSITLRRGGLLTVTNNDVMPHKLVLTSGPALHIAHATLGRMGASLKVALTKPGTYHFTTKPGEDYPGMSGMKTTGEDNVLKLTVVVS